MTDYCLTILRVLLYLGRVGKNAIRVDHLVTFVPNRFTSKILSTITELC